MDEHLLDLAQRHSCCSEPTLTWVKVFLSFFILRFMDLINILRDLILFVGQCDIFHCSEN